MAVLGEHTAAACCVKDDRVCLRAGGGTGSGAGLGMRPRGAGHDTAHPGGQARGVPGGWPPGASGASATWRSNANICEATQGLPALVCAPSSMVQTWEKVMIGCASSVLSM